MGPVKHEEVAIYAVNQRIPNVLELRELLCSGAIRDIIISCFRLKINCTAYKILAGDCGFSSPPKAKRPYKGELCHAM